MSASDPAYHIPALVGPVIELLDVKPDGTYVDVTFGGGGHSRAILDALGPQGRLFGMDQDLDAQQNSIDDPRFTFVHGNFAFLANFMRYHGVSHVDGVLADLGVSFHHFDDGERGFSFRHNTRLDMRMNRLATTDARTVLHTLDEDELADMFHLYGELRQARRLAGAIVQRRTTGALDTTGDLVDTVTPFIAPKQLKKELAQVFQALRIKVNHEMEALRRLLEQATALLSPEGRLAVITYHSLEDRMVKNWMRSGNVEGRVEKDFFGHINPPLRAVNNRVITADDDEVTRNPRSRSAKLRVAQRNIQH